MEREWVHKMWFMGKQLRVWTQASPEFPPDERTTQKAEIEKVLYQGTTSSALESLGGLPWVNAVELMDSTGTGMILYPEWP